MIGPIKTCVGLPVKEGALGACLQKPTMAHNVVPRLANISPKMGIQSLKLLRGSEIGMHGRDVKVRSAALIQGDWGVWATLLCVGGGALHLERSEWGKGFNAPLLATLLGLLVSNFGIIPSHLPHIHGIVNSYLLPLAVPLLLFSGNLSRVLSTGRLLLSFTCASIATVLGSILACALVPLSSLGVDGHKIAGALTARHIGGSINYVAVTELLGVGPDARMSALAADDVIVTLYFIALYSVAKKREKIQNPEGDNDAVLSNVDDDNKRNNNDAKKNDRVGSASISILDGATALGLSAMLCAMGNSLCIWLGYKGGNVAITTLLTVCFATVTPKSLLTNSLISSGEGIGAILLQIFFASVGASGNLKIVVETAPKLFVWSLIAVVVHFAAVFGFEKVFGYPRRETLLSSNANIGGPATAASMASAFNWTDMIIPSILIGILGYTIGTPIGIATSPLFKHIFALNA
eukprot:jgi/Picsp_1/2009/NSC_05475-R1_protein